MPSAEYMAEYRERRRAQAIQLLGNVCATCGSTEELCFDHIDPDSKEFHISGFSKPWKEILKELGKCQLLCARCHARKTSNENAVRFTKGCGSVAQYKRGCHCDPCRNAMREARRRWRINRHRRK